MKNCRYCFQISIHLSCVVGRMKVFLFLLFLSYPVSFTYVQGATFLEEYNDSYLGRWNTAAPSLSPLLPASPQYPMLPNGSAPLLSDLCGLKISSVKEILTRTAEDCTAPLAKYVGNAICCPQFKSMLQIFNGEHSFISGSLGLNDSDALECIADIMNVLIENGANTSITELCNIQPTNMTGGLCPVTSVKKFEQIIDTNKLLNACSIVDPLTECCNAICQPAITDAAVRLTSNSSTLNLQQLVNDCEDIVYAWLARELGLEVSISAFRLLYNCKVNQVCPLIFNDNTSSVSTACSGNSPSKSKCCAALSAYISTLQQQMLITNMQALECVTLFASMLKKEGVVANIYNICQVDLKDFSLQVYGQQGCLLRSVPSDIVYDNVSGISFTCDLNDNIPAPWPLDTSLSSFPLCANRETLPALPMLHTSGNPGTFIQVQALKNFDSLLFIALGWVFALITSPHA